MIRLLVTGLLIFFFSSCLNAGKLDKAFEALRIYDYFKAKSLFTSSLKKHPSAAAFGLATIYYRSDNPFHSYDSAFVYIQRAEQSYALTTEKWQLKYKELGLEYLQIIDLRAQISTAFYQRADQVNTCDSWNQYLDEHPWSIQFHQAVHKRDSIAYQEVTQENTSAAYQLFIENYPESHLLNEAQQEFFKTQFYEITVSGTLQSYVNFLTKCSGNPFVPSAEDRIYELAVYEPSVQVVSDFLKNYPSNRNIGKAWRYLYQLFMADYADDQIDRFIATYPGYPYKEELEKDLYLNKLKLLPYKLNNLFGFMNDQGDVVIQPEYEQLGFFKEGLASATKNGKVGFIDKSNQVIISFQFDAAVDFENGRSIVEQDGKFGMIDRSGNAIFPLIYEDIGQLSEGLIYALKDSLYGYYDRNNNERISPRFGEAFAFSNGMAKVVFEEKQAFIDTYGKFVVEPLYESLQVFSDSVLVAEKEGRFGLIAFSGKPLTEFIFDQVGQLSVNRALVVINNLVGYIDKKGSVVIPPKFELFPNFLKRGQFSGAYALVSLKGKMGVIDQSGKVIVPLTFSGLGDVSSMMSFSKGKQWGFIDLSGKQLVEPSFDFAESVKEGKTLVEKNGLQGMIDAKGKVLIPIEYVSINRLSRDWWVVSNGSRSGLWNDKEGFLFAPTYQQIRLIDAQHIVFMNPDSIEYLYLPEKRVIKVKVSE